MLRCVKGFRLFSSTVPKTGRRTTMKGDEMKDETKKLQAQEPGRRDFMKKSGAAVAGVSLISAGGLLTAATESWAQSLSTLDAPQAGTLLRMCRDIYPHDLLGDDIYAKVVEGLDAAAAKDASLAQSMTEGLKELNAMARRMFSRDYAQVSREADRVAVLQKMESSGFFQKVRGDMITGIYNNPDVWKVLGYEGASAHLGGYLKRGFDDLDWL
jgi:hypothetical protein